MSFLLKVLSDMLQKSSTTFSHPHMSQTKVKLGPTETIYPAPPSSVDIATTKNPSLLVSPIGISVSPRWDCNLSIFLRNVSVKPR